MTASLVTSSNVLRSHPDVEIVLHPIPSAGSAPYIVVYGPDRHLWFCESGTSKIGRFDPDNATFTEFDIPDAERQADRHHSGSGRCAVVLRERRQQDRPHHHRRVRSPNFR